MLTAKTMVRIAKYQSNIHQRIQNSQEIIEAIDENYVMVRVNEPNSNNWHFELQPKDISHSYQPPMKLTEIGLLRKEPEAEFNMEKVHIPGTNNFYFALNTSENYKKNE